MRYLDSKLCIKFLVFTLLFLAYYYIDTRH
nr:MAG TPA: hypothetical protein [Bacteriophage sp.]